MDMLPSFMAGMTKAFPKAKITFDRFHVVKLINEAMDTLRKLEQQENKALKGHKYTFLKYWDRLSDKPRGWSWSASWTSTYPTLGEAIGSRHSSTISGHAQYPECRGSPRSPERGGPAFRHPAFHAVRQDRLVPLDRHCPPHRVAPGQRLARRE
jgi:hypothetical protein